MATAEKSGTSSDAPHATSGHALHSSPHDEELEYLKELVATDPKFSKVKLYGIPKEYAPNVAYHAMILKEEFKDRNDVEFYYRDGIVDWRLKMRTKVRTDAQFYEDYYHLSEIMRNNSKFTLSDLDKIDHECIEDILYSARTLHVDFYHATDKKFYYDYKNKRFIWEDWSPEPHLQRVNI